MPEAAFACPKCHTAFGIQPGTDHVSAACPNCSSFLEGYFFAPYFRASPVGEKATALVDHTEASCFYHTQKQAVGICDGCGRLLCSLCSIDLGQERLCPNCLSSGKKKGKLTSLENSRTRYDSIALTLSICCIVFSFLSVILAPASIYIAIRHWNSPGSLLGVSKKRFVFAIVISLLALIFWAALFSVGILAEPSTAKHK